MSHLFSRVLVGVALVAFLTVVTVSIAAAMPVMQEEGEGQAYIVQRGDSLYAISERLLGNGALWASIHEATNAKAASDSSFAVIDNPRLIFVGQKLWVPSAAAGEHAEMMGEEADKDADDAMASDGDAADADAGEMMADDDGAATEDEMASEKDEDDGEMMAAEAPNAILAGAVEQLAVALNHVGLLQSSLEASDLAGAQVHTEHVINILDGEEGDNFGDGNRDGKTQNPGDGVGVRVYLVDGGLDMEAQVLDAIESADKLFAVDTVEEAEAIAGELAASLTALDGAVADAIAQGGSGEAAGEEMEAAEDDSSATAAAPDMGESLAAAQKQVELAAVHYGFYLDAQDTDDLPGAVGHVEHFINILDGEGGSYFGDNNRDGQTQNPGDGVGIRGHLEAVLAQTDEGELRSTVDQALALVEAGTSEAIQIFGVDSVADAQPIGEAFGAILSELQDKVAEIEGMVN